MSSLMRGVIMKNIIAIIIIVLALTAVILFIYINKNDGLEIKFGLKNDNDNTGDENTVGVTDRPMPPKFTPDEKWEIDWQEKWKKHMILEETKFAEDIASIPIDMDLILQSIRSDNITEADSLEIQTMLSQFSDTMTTAAIIETLFSFFPEDNRFPGLQDILTDYYEGSSKLYGGRLSYNQRILMAVHFTHNQLSNIRAVEEMVAEKLKVRDHLLKTDPDLYYDTEISNLNTLIADSENIINEAELSGDIYLVETEQKHLLALKKRIDELNFEKNFDQEIEKMAKQLIIDRFPDGNYHNWVEKLLDDMQADALNNISTDDIDIDDIDIDDIDTDAPALDNTPSQISSQSNKSLDSLLSDVGENYLDVVISRYFTPAEFNKNFPNLSDTHTLKTRTIQLQTELATEVRKVLNRMNNVSEIEKRQLAREFLINNFDEEFAKAVLKFLDNLAD